VKNTSMARKLLWAFRVLTHCSSEAPGVHLFCALDVYASLSPFLIALNDMTIDDGLLPVDTSNGNATARSSVRASFPPDGDVPSLSLYPFSPTVIPYPFTREKITHTTVRTSLCCAVHASTGRIGEAGGRRRARRGRRRRSSRRRPWRGSSGRPSRGSHAPAQGGRAPLGEGCPASAVLRDFAPPRKETVARRDFVCAIASPI
jgi:hypothetical protein